MESPHVRIRRQTRQAVATVGTATATSSSIRSDDMAGAAVVIKGNTVAATLTVWGSCDDVTFSPLYGPDGAAATLTIPGADAAVDIPAAAYAAPWFRLVASDALSTSTTVAVALKT